MSVTGPLIIPTLPAAGSPSYNSTLKQLRDRVYMTLRDSDHQFMTPEMIDYFLTEGYLDICARLRLNKAEVSSTTTSDSKIPFPTGYIEVDQEGLTLGTRIASEVTSDQFDSYAVPGNTVDYIIYRIFNGNIELYSTSLTTANTAYKLRYVKIPTKPSVDSDVFSVLPAELEVRLVNYARAHARYVSGDMDDGDRYMAIYRAGIPDYPRASQRFGHGPAQMVPMPGVFDE